MNNKLLISIFLSVFITGCSSTPEKKDETDANVFINDYPTRDRVDYVLNCVAKHGGLNYINQYACGCKIDKIAEKLSFKEYESAQTFSYLKKTPGEKGAAFRDPEHGNDLRKRLKEAEQFAETQCFVK
jgi:hypothetical protein